MIEKDEEERLEQLAKQGIVLVRGMNAGFDIGWNQAVDWAADWILSQLAVETNERTIEFARNMAMSIHANRRAEPPKQVKHDH